jgi:Domain of unknown function (DUF222)
MFDGAFSLLHQILHPDGGTRMKPGPAPPDPDPDTDPDQALPGRDEVWEAWLASRERCEDDEPLELEDEGDYYDDPAELAEITAEARRASADQAAAEAHIAASGQTAALAAGASVALGRRGPGMPGSAEPLAGEYSGPGGAFATGQALDLAPGGPVLLGQVDWAAGDDDGFDGVGDDELLGIICAADRCEAAASALKHTAVAELIRRRPASGCTPQGPAGMPEAWDEFTRAELAPALGESRYAVDGLLDLAHDLTVKLPGTMALFRVGVISRYKAQVISHATQLLDPAEARAAEAMVLDRAGRLTPGTLRAAIARAVMEVAPEKARKRREKAAKSTDVLQWAEFSGNAALAGRELPPADVLAAGQRIRSWADQLKAAGLEGSTGELRARAFLDLLLGRDSRPDKVAASGMGPAAFVATINLTIPLATLLDLADRPGEIPGIGPIDPWLARDLARSAASHPKTKWCVTVTDKQGHAIGHGCARPEPRGRKKEPGRQKGPGPPGYTFTPADQHGPRGGFGAWRLRTPGDGPDLRISLDPLNTQNCDHWYQARGHDPGVKLRHLSQIRHATCTGPCCRRPSARSDFEHNIPYEAGGRTCLCNGGPKCRYDHRLKQHPKWKVDQLPDGTFRWTTPSGRQYTTEPTRYPT